MSFPTNTDSFTVVSGTTLLSTGHASLHNEVGSAVIALEQKIGVGAGSPTLNRILKGSGNGTSVWGTTLDNFTFGTPSTTGGTMITPLISGGTVNNPVIGTPAITGGTYNSGVFGTPTILGGSIAVSGTTVALTIGAGLVPTAGSVADAAGGTLTVNAQTSNVFFSVQGTAAGNRTIGTPLNPTAWQSITYFFKTSGSANGTLVWDSGAFALSQDIGTPALGTGTLWHAYNWRYNPVTSKHQFMGQSLNIN